MQFVAFCAQVRVDPQAGVRALLVAAIVAVLGPTVGGMRTELPAERLQRRLGADPDTTDIQAPADSESSDPTFGRMPEAAEDQKPTVVTYLSSVSALFEC